jgi:hypothetical protein
MAESSIKPRSLTAVPGIPGKDLMADAILFACIDYILYPAVN